MVKRIDVALISIWNHDLGAIAWEPDRQIGVFEFFPEFANSGLDLAPLVMPLSRLRKGNEKFLFPELSKATYHGLPGLLADALPDRFGNAVIDRWLAGQGRTRDEFSPVERLCYMGKRGMGALEFKPPINRLIDKSVRVEISALVNLAQNVLDKRQDLVVNLKTDDKNAMLDILRVGTSAGGNRPKAVIALNDKTGEVRSGQVKAPPGFDFWLLKFDGVKDLNLADPQGYGRIEYAYYKMAKACGIEMTECRLYEEHNRAHFMTRRFDRIGPEKIHTQTLCALAHFDFNNPGSYSYEQAFQVMLRLQMPHNEIEQLYRRMIFNVIARNQDDHSKNISFKMNKHGGWHLAPAYDIIYAYNPAGKFTSLHQMSINNKRDDLQRDDLLKVGELMNIKRRKQILEQIISEVSAWPEQAKAAGVDKKQVDKIQKTLRLSQ